MESTATCPNGHPLTDAYLIVTNSVTYRYNDVLRVEPVEDDELDEPTIVFNTDSEKVLGEDTEDHELRCGTCNSSVAASYDLDLPETRKASLIDPSRA